MRGSLHDEEQPVAVASDLPPMSLEDFGQPWLAKVRSSCLHMVSNKRQPQA